MMFIVKNQFVTSLLKKQKRGYSAKNALTSSNILQKILTMLKSLWQNNSYT
jgi:hypothetical protein